MKKIKEIETKKQYYSNDTYAESLDAKEVVDKLNEIIKTLNLLSKAKKK